MSELPGRSERQADSLEHLMSELMTPLDPQELAATNHSGELHTKALLEQTTIAGLQGEASELQRQLDEISIQVADATARKAAYMEAFEIARAIEDGK